MSKLVRKPSYLSRLERFKSYLSGGLFSGPERYSLFSGPMYAALYNSWKRVGKVPHAQAVRLARYGTYQAANESGYGSHPYSKNYNYGNLVNGKGGYQTFKNMLEYADAFVGNMGEHFPNARNASDFDSYMDSLLNGEYIYAENPNYVKDVRGTMNRVDLNIDSWLQVNSKPAPKPKVTKPVQKPKETLSWFLRMMLPIINNPIFYSK